jgi:hypothetical protein
LFLRIAQHVDRYYRTSAGRHGVTVAHYDDNFLALLLALH